MTIVCLGEAIADLICERELDAPEEADSFVPHPGGALANVAVAAARAGGRAALLGGVGDDPWGRWLRTGLENEGVYCGWLATAPSVPTPLAIATFARGREPSFQVYGAGIAETMQAGAEHLDDAMAKASALVFGSNTLVGETERRVTLEARRRALELGVPVLFDPNLRPNRWREMEVAIDFCRELCQDSFVVRANRAEASALTGIEDAGGVGDGALRAGREAGGRDDGSRGGAGPRRGEWRGARSRGRRRRTSGGRGRIHGRAGGPAGRARVGRRPGGRGATGRDRGRSPRLRGLGSAVSESGWRRPRRRRVLAIRDRLREMYGRPVNRPHGHPIAELVRTVLSQNTNDRNRDRAFAGLRERFPTWEEVRDAPTEEVEEAIRPGGLSKQKAPRIQEILGRLGDHPDLDWTADARREESLDFLTALPGVGRKTAACVLIFTWGIPEIPVDVHVYRVGGRLGLFRPSASFPEAHDEMLAITDPADAYELHMNLIRHGREVCRPAPRCGECELRRMCPWYRQHA